MTRLTPERSDDPLVQAERRGYALGRLDAAALVAKELDNTTVLYLLKALRQSVKTGPVGVDNVLAQLIEGEDHP